MTSLAFGLIWFVVSVEVEIKMRKVWQQITNLLEKIFLNLLSIVAYAKCRDPMIYY